MINKVNNVTWHWCEWSRVAFSTHSSNSCVALHLARFGPCVRCVAYTGL